MNSNDLFSVKMLARHMCAIVVITNCYIVLFLSFLPSLQLSTKMRFIIAIFAIIAIISTKVVRADDENNSIDDDSPTPCRCGVFLTGQIPKSSGQEPEGNAALQTEAGPAFANNAIGNRQCINKCLEHIVKHLPKSADIICATLGRDCHKERAYLFVQNYVPKWINSNMSAGREYCCKDNLPYKCPII